MPDNAIYYHAAYAAAAVLYGGYVISLMRRARRFGKRETGNAGNDDEAHLDAAGVPSVLAHSPH